MNRYTINFSFGEKDENFEIVYSFKYKEKEYQLRFKHEEDFNGWVVHLSKSLKLCEGVCSLKTQSYTISKASETQVVEWISEITNVSFGAGFSLENQNKTKDIHFYFRTDDEANELIKGGSMQFFTKV